MNNLFEDTITPIGTSTTSCGFADESMLIRGAARLSVIDDELCILSKTMTYYMYSREPVALAFSVDGNIVASDAEMDLETGRVYVVKMDDGTESFTKIVALVNGELL